MTLLICVSPKNIKEEALVWLEHNLVVAKVVSLLDGVWWLTVPTGRLMLVDSGLALGLLWPTVCQEVVRSSRSCLWGSFLGIHHVSYTANFSLPTPADG